MSEEKIADNDMANSVPLSTFARELKNHATLTEYIQKILGVPIAPIEADSLKLSDEERRQRLGAKIRLMRKGIGLKQSELAAKIGVTKAAVTAYELGKSEPNLKNLIGLSRVLGVTTDWLLGEAPLPE